jgi:hypothetical protein
MKTFYTNLKFCLLAFSFIGISTASLFAQTSISSIGSTYTQDFNSLSGTWTDNTTIASWYTLDATPAPSTSISLNDGSGTTVGLTSFGSIGSPDRSLGFFPLGNIGDKMYVGWRFKNTMLTTTINSLVITWTGEQWRDEDTSPQTINLVYQISPTSITSIDPGSLESASLFFTSPQRTGAQISLDGNLAANRVTNTHTITESIAPGSEIIVVWETSDLNPNHLMAIDDISVTAKASQTITFTTPPTKTYGDATFSSGATTNSGLTITLTSSNALVATVSGNNITIVGPGKSDITAYQSGNGSYDAAAPVLRTLSVKPKIPVTIEATNITTTSFQANWTADNGLNDAGTTYSLQYATNASFTGAPPPKTSSVKNVTVNSLSPNTIYYYRVYAINNTVASSYNVASAITTGSDYRSNADGEWTNGNWQIDLGGNSWISSPTNAIANSIEIRNNTSITAGGPITTNSLLIRSYAKLTTNQQILVTNQLVIEVDALGNSGQIWNTGNITVGANARLIVRKTFSNPLKWQFMGFPFNVASADVFNGGSQTALNWGDLNSGADYVVQQYNGNTRASAGTANYNGQGIHWGNVSSKTFTANRGYIIYKNSAGTIDFTSRGSNIGNFFSINGASVTTDRHNSNEEHRDWNLIISPLSTKFNLGSTSPGATYYAYNGTNYLPALTGEGLDVQPFKSFFLQATSNSQSFANGGRKVSALTAKETQAEVDDIYLNLSNGNSTYDDVTRIRLQDGASPDYVIGTDAVKMFGMDANVSYIYSTINGQVAAINTLPRTTSAVDLQTRFAATGNYSISISNTDKVNNYAAVILYDKVTGRSTDLLSTGSYAYTTSTTGTTNRFSVQFAPKITTGVSVSTDGKIQISSTANAAIINGLSANAQLAVYDTSGKSVFVGTISNGQAVSLNKGLYIFEITTLDKTTRLKSFIR